jgi:quinol monooxygenase YgiN
MIHVIASIDLSPGRRDQYLAEFRRNVPNVLAEKGCLEYGPTIDVASQIPVQPPVRENVVVVVEKWESLEALRTHLAAPHMLAFRERVKEMVKGVSLLVLEPA